MIRSLNLLSIKYLATVSLKQFQSPQTDPSDVLRHVCCFVLNCGRSLWERGGSVAEWLACWTQAQKGPGSNDQIAVATLSGNSLWQTVHTHCASVHQATKLVAALLSRGVVGRGDGVPPLFSTAGHVPHFPTFGLKFVQKLVHCCNWLLTETQCKIILVQQN